MFHLHDILRDSPQDTVKLARVVDADIVNEHAGVMQSIRQQLLENRLTIARDGNADPTAVG